MKKSALIVAAALALGGGAMSVWSASTPSASTNPSSPADSPSAPWQERRREAAGELMGRDGSMMRNPRQWSRENDALARPVRPEAQWGDVDWFMNQWTPNRWAKFKEMPDGLRKEKLKSIVTSRYRAMQELKLNDTETYQLRVKRLQIEDRIFDLGWRVNHNGEPPTTQPVVAAAEPPTTNPAVASLTPEELRAQLRTEVRALIANRIEERELHVKQLRDRLNTETARLKDEQSNVERLVEMGMTNIEKQRWPGIGGEMVPPMPGGGAQQQPQQRPRGDSSEAREPAALAPPEASEQQ